MSKNINKDGSGIIKYLTEKTTLPSDLLAGEVCVEIRGRKSLLMQGCRRILKYSPEEMILSAKGFDVSVRGAGLVCLSYHEGAVIIDGKIENVDFGKRGE